MVAQPGDDMKRSTDRILTTHVGSLVRPPEVLEGILTRVSGQPRDEAAFNEQVRAGVVENVRMQAEVGIDIPSDGEVGKSSFSGYVAERLGGLKVVAEPPPALNSPNNYPILNEEFPGFMAQYNAMYRTIWMPRSIPRDLVDAAIERTRHEHLIVADKITYQGQAEIGRDLAVFKEALQGLQFEEAFVPAATPSRTDEDPDHVYPSEQAYLYDVADAMREEYRAIVDAGFIVQLDLGLPARNQVLPGKPRPTWEELRRASEMQVEAYNHALQGIPEDRVRYHLCWGSMNTPHTSDIPLKDIVDLILKINAQAYSIEAANPRHEHEWMVWKDVKLPDGKILIPGIVSHQTNVVEHPELVAWRIKNYAGVVGKENVIASTDCGFSQGWSMIRVHPEVQWAKLRTLAEGAALASKELWGRA
jgi:5-methyltetrahydropteroyltriglutamate--homocysteine methyltransferase